MSKDQMALIMQHKTDKMLPKISLEDIGTPGSANNLSPAKLFTMRPMTSCKNCLKIFKFYFKWMK